MCTSCEESREGVDDCTRLIQSLQSDGVPSDEVLPLVYNELRRQAQAMLQNEKPGQTLQATALVHEAFLRIAGSKAEGWAGRRQFFAASAEAMRRILIDRARRKKRTKRGGDYKRWDLDDVDLAIESPTDDILAVDEALQKLEAVDPRARSIVNLRFFAGFTNKECADALGLSVSTVEAEWRFIRAWLNDRLEAP
ncbi:MAG: sigma-70 family RNA polymerase sigma factor [Planctomycetes bacterium]|nr:sigma-70 family RNA polymerase sigma factor [Planctomycetota bacterium]MCB9917644.1 sigma-70 family RNA polymerase sigma factor [Planctomycetota bacterium]